MYTDLPLNIYLNSKSLGKKLNVGHNMRVIGPKSFEVPKWKIMEVNVLARFSLIFKIKSLFDANEKLNHVLCCHCIDVLYF